MTSQRAATSAPPSSLPASPSGGWTAADVAALALSAAAGLFGLWALQVGWDDGILDVHAWRQSHTAITVQDMLRGGPFWRYRTPIFGPPWQWPLELPIYQWIVAGASRASGAPIEPTARAISVTFFFGLLAAGWFALDLFDVKARHKPIVLSLFLASPLYIFWSRTFMIESTALCFAMIYLVAADRAMRGARESTPVAASLAAAAFGVLAGMTKVTTFTPFIAGVAMLAFVRARQGRWSRRRTTTTLLAVLVVPLAASAIWLWFADAQKMSNPIAAELVWSGERNQRFGSLADRFRLRSWYAVPANAIVGGTRHAVIGSLPVFAAALALLALRRRRLAIAAACIALYGLTIAVFMGLFLAHVYYQYENGFLILLILGCAIVTGLEGPLAARAAGVALLASALAAMTTSYLRGYYVDQASGSLAPMTVGVLADRLTAPDDVLLIYGAGYSPAVAYSAGRRAIMDWKDRSVNDPAIRSVLSALARDGGRIGAIVVCGDSRTNDVVRLNIAALGFAGRPRHSERSCDLYLRRLQ